MSDIRTGSGGRLGWSSPNRSCCKRAPCLPWSDRREGRHVEFDYFDSCGATLHTSEVELRLFSAEELAAALTVAGFGHIRFLPGHGGLSEILAQTSGGDHR
ncbi:MAG: hypothetical protein ACRDTG_15170 [Pseudonocardiaceae bacterium]